MVAREGSAPSTSGCRPDVILFHHRAVLAHGHDWLPGLDLHQHKRLQRALSYELDDPAKWWPASVTLRVQRLKRPLLHFKDCRPKWCSRQDSHPHLRRSQRRASAGWATRAQNWSPHPELHRTGSHTKGVHRSKCFGGLKIGVPDRLRSGDLLLERQAC